jgi:hypothetical protein
MAGVFLQQRCWNHEAREAVCRCPACGRSFCHECVTEHELRLLCAACLRLSGMPGVTATGQSKRSAWRSVLPTGMLLAGFLLAWIFFYGAAQSLSFFTERAEQSSWQNR